MLRRFDATLLIPKFLNSPLQSNFMETYTNRHLRPGPTLDGKAEVDLQLMMDKIRLPIDLIAQR